MKVRVLKQKEKRNFIDHKTAYCFWKEKAGVAPGSVTLYNKLWGKLRDHHKEWFRMQAPGCGPEQQHLLEFTFSGPPQTCWMRNCEVGPSGLGSMDRALAC